jgi:hypothetical protein
MTLDEMHDAVSGVVDAAIAQFMESNPARLAQLTSSSETVLMAIDALFTEVPYRS